MDDSEQRWKQLVKAAKPALEESEAPPPEEFGTRIARLRSSIRALALALTWRRWSILAALLAALVFAILFWLLRDETPDRPPIIQPEPPSHLRPMKPTFREYLSILVALLTILACGIGVGYLIGERHGRREALSRMPDPGQDPPKGAWEDRTLTRLTKQLDLSDSQKTLVAGEIQRTSKEIRTSRDQALEEYYQHLLTLHDRILPHLAPAQRAEIEADKKNLQQTIKLRFKSSITPGNKTHDGPLCGENPNPQAAMSRSHFALAVALVVIAATLVFIKSFPDDPARPDPARTSRSTSPAGTPNRAAPDRFGSSKPLTPRPANDSSFEIGFSKATLASLTDEQRRKALGFAATAEADALSTLADLTRDYDLTRQQQRDIFPIVAAHTDSYHPSMAVNGVPVIPAPAGSSLEESIHGSLDARQQAALTDAMIDDIKWWQEIASQLEDDLNTAIDAGEVSIGGPAISVDTTPAEGDGEAASHSGGNIFDLLNQGN